MRCPSCPSCPSRCPSLCPRLAAQDRFLPGRRHRVQGPGHSQVPQVAEGMRSLRHPLRLLLPHRRLRRVNVARRVNVMCKRAPCHATCGNKIIPRAKAIKSQSDQEPKRSRAKAAAERARTPYAFWAGWMGWLENLLRLLRLLLLLLRGPRLLPLFKPGPFIHTLTIGNTPTVNTNPFLKYIPRSTHRVVPPLASSVNTPLFSMVLTS